MGGYQLGICGYMPCVEDIFTTASTRITSLRHVQTSSLLSAQGYFPSFSYSNFHSLPLKSLSLAGVPVPSGFSSCTFPGGNLKAVNVVKINTIDIKVPEMIDKIAASDRRVKTCLSLQRTFDETIKVPGTLVVSDIFRKKMGGI